MKEISELVLPADIRYTKDHEWARKEGLKVRIGISDYAQDQLGDIVFVELPPVGSSFSKGGQFGTVESVKAVSEIYAPVDMEIVETNAALADAPETVNASPLGDAWLAKVKATNPSQLGSLMSQADYDAMDKEGH